MKARKMNFAEVYEDRKGEWRWRVIAKNGKIVADSGEGYNSKTVCRNRLKMLFNMLEEIAFPFPPEDKDLRIRIIPRKKKAIKVPAAKKPVVKKPVAKKARAKK